MFNSRFTKFLNKNLHVLGLENVTVKDTDFLFKTLKQSFSDVNFQIFDAEKIAGKAHIEFAVLNALKAFKTGKNISKSLPVEVMLYVSSQRQIGKALKMVGISPETKNLVLVVFGVSSDVASKVLDEVHRLVGGKINSEVVEVNREKIETIKKTFEISDLEIETQMFGNITLEEAIKKLVIERIALLATQQ